MHGHIRITRDLKVDQRKTQYNETDTNHTTPDRIIFFVDWDKTGDWEAVDFIK